LGLRSIHNGTEIAFLLEWQDNTKNDRLTPGTFRDGVAIGLPLGDAPAFFCMGQLDHYINIWHWKADWQSDIDRRAAKASEGKASGEVRRFEVIPRRKSSVEDLIGGILMLTTKDDQPGCGASMERWSLAVVTAADVQRRQRMKRAGSGSPASGRVRNLEWRTKSATARKPWHRGSNWPLTRSRACDPEGAFAQAGRTTSPPAG
jgi:hypothetical protein